MSGIRVHHPVYRSGTYTVETPRMYPKPYSCPLCHRTHLFKANHIDLDDGGNGMVSEGVLAELQQVGMAGLEIVNEVKEPPPLIIGGPNGHRRVVGSLILKEG